MAGPVPAADLEDALFAGVRQHLESMIGWARSGEALALEHDQFEGKTLTNIASAGADAMYSSTSRRPDGLIGNSDITIVPFGRVTGTLQPPA